VLGLEPLLRARLADVSGLVGVHGAPELADHGGGGQEMPCAFVVWAGYRVREAAGSGKVARVDSRWHVVLVVKNTDGQSDGQAARADADVLLRALLSRLLGWLPGAGYSPLVLADDAPRPTFRGGLLRFPIAVTSTVVVKGD